MCLSFKKEDLVIISAVMMPFLSRLGVLKVKENL
jgi:hypothetical protein